MFVTALVCIGFQVCERAPLRVIDGDTFVVAGEHIRLSEIDAPEIHGRCGAETALAAMARSRLTKLLNHRTIMIDREGIDRYGRTLATVMSDGVDVSEVLYREGLARRWTVRWNHDRSPWCH